MPSMIPNVRQYVHLYIFVSVLFIVGVIFGAILVNALTLEQQEELSRQVSQVFVNISVSEGSQSFWSSLWTYWRWVSIIALLGLSIIGFPLILIVDFLKGVLIGFTVGTLVSQYSWKGVFVALAAVAPQNMFAIPLLLMASVASIAFALHILKHRLFVPKLRSIKQQFLDYALAQAGSGVGLIGVAAFVTWVSPILMYWVSSLVIL
ncbi:stage II sporulation protein M [Paenibacillus marinisediminis]